VEQRVRFTGRPPAPVHLGPAGRAIQVDEAMAVTDIAAEARGQPPTKRATVQHQRRLRQLRADRRRPSQDRRRDAERCRTCHSHHDLIN